MNITKQELLNTIQLSINMYEGEHGKVEKILDTEIKEKVKDVDLVTGWLDNNYYIVFKGTSGWKEWLEDLDFPKKSPFFEYCSKVTFHEGFLEHYQKIRDTIWSRLVENEDKIIKNNSTVYITGHSLGAITATLCASDLNINSPFQIKVVTYGSPRGFNKYGSKDFSRRFSTNICQSYRVVYRNDLVTKVPMMWMNFKHTSSKIWLNKMKWWEVVLHPYLRIFGNVLDHYPERILEEVKKMRGVR